jgi:hypothetical protein
MLLSCASSAIIQGACVVHGIEEWEFNKGHLYTFSWCVLPI